MWTAVGIVVAFVVGVGCGVYVAPKLAWVQGKVDEIRRRLTPR